MRIFDIFKKKKEQPLTTDQKLDRLWELWEIGDIKMPVAALMTYESEVNNGGHDQYFFNLANNGKLKANMDAVLPALPEVLRENLNRGYEAFAAQEDISDDENEELFEACDDVFYANEHLLIDVLKGYAEELL